MTFLSLRSRLALLLTAVSLLLAGNYAVAQTSGDEHRSTPPRELAVALARLLSEGNTQAFGTLTDSGSAADTGLALRIRRMATAHVLKYSPPDSLLTLVADDYARLFTEAELRELLTFYRSPLGVRIRQRQTEALETMRRAIQARLAPHQAELSEKINLAVQEKLKLPPV